MNPKEIEDVFYEQMMRVTRETIDKLESFNRQYSWPY